MELALAGASAKLDMVLDERKEAILSPYIPQLLHRPALLSLTTPPLPYPILSRSSQATRKEAEERKEFESQVISRLEGLKAGQEKTQTAVMSPTTFSSSRSSASRTRSSSCTRARR